MAVKGPGASAQSMTILQRAARLYEGEHWWLADTQGEPRGLLLLDGGADLVCLREDIVKRVSQGGRFAMVGQEAVTPNGHAAWTRPAAAGRHDCQVTVEERTQLFGFLRKG